MFRFPATVQARRLTHQQTLLVQLLAQGVAVDRPEPFWVEHCRWLPSSHRNLKRYTLLFKLT